jgi:hypothetical protein
MLSTRQANKVKIGELMKVIKGDMTKIKEADLITIEGLSTEEDSLITSMGEEGMLIMMTQKLMQIYRNRKKIRENLLTTVIFLDDFNSSLYE